MTPGSVAAAYDSNETVHDDERQTSYGDHLVPVMGSMG